MSDASPERGPAWAPLAVVSAMLWAWFIAPGWWEPLADPDKWWLLWAGEQLRAGDWPVTNALSWTAPDHPWVLHETAVAWLYALVGVQWVGVLRGLVLSVTGMVMLQLAWRPRHGWATAFALAWAAPLFSFAVSERALIYGNLLLAVLVWALWRKARWSGPLGAVLVALWPWVHGSFVVGALVLLVHRWRWGVVGLAASLLTEVGRSSWWLVLSYGTGESVLALVHEHIEEWYWMDPLTFGWTRPVFLVAGALLLFTGKTPLTARLLYSGLAVLAVRHWRFADVLSIAVLPYVADRLTQLLPPREGGLPQVWFVGLLGLAAVVGRGGALDEARHPSALLEELDGAERRYNDFGLGGWLGQHGHTVFWDSRNDCYPYAVFADALALDLALEDPLPLLAQWEIDQVVTERRHLVEAVAAEGWTHRATVGTFQVWER